jgi:hypothetical protein
MKMLEQADNTEKLVALAQLPAPTIVGFSRRSPSSGRTSSYAAIVVENANPKERGPYEGRKWFVTNAGRYPLGPFTDQSFIEWLIAGDVNDIAVAVTYVTLEEATRLNAQGAGPSDNAS